MTGLTLPDISIPQTSSLNGECQAEFFLDVHGMGNPIKDFLHHNYFIIIEPISSKPSAFIACEIEFVWSQGCS